MVFSVSKKSEGNHQRLFFAITACLISALLMIAMSATLKTAYFLYFTSTVLTVISVSRFVCQNRIDSILLVYVVTYGLYGLSAPLTVIFYDGHFPRYAFTDKNLRTLGEVYALGILATLLVCVVFVFQFPERTRSPIDPAVPRPKYAFLARQRSIPYILALLSSGLYIQSIGAADFTKTIFLGKGYFAGLIGDQYFSFFTTPLAFAAIYLYFGPPAEERPRSRTGVFLLVLSLSPLLFFYMLTGERSSIMSLAIVWMLSFSLNKKIKFRVKYLAYAAAFFLILTFIYSGRSWVSAYVMGQSDWKGFQSESILKNFNPANSEFHAGSGNFSTYIENPKSRELPTTYLGVFLHLFPRWVLPFKKPTEVSIWFNRTYYPELESINVRVGFSSWVEGYMNGGRIGVFFHFFMTTTLALSLDWIRRKANSPFTAFMPIALSALFIKFHRTSLAVFAGYTFETFVVWSLTFLVLLFLFQRRRA